MVTVRELQERVTTLCERLALPSWPDPHPGSISPGAEEYSRVTHPERHRVVHARAGAWAAVLEDALGARSEKLAPVPVRGEGSPEAFDRGVRVLSGKPGTLPLLLLERDVPQQLSEATLAVLQIAVVRPDVVVDSEPDCGCDACDSGSSDLLEAVDATIRQVVGGPFVVVQGDRWRAQWSPEGGSAGSEGRGPDFRSVMDLCRRLAAGEPVRVPKDTEALVGRSWLD